MPNNSMLSVKAAFQDERKLKFVKKFMKIAKSVADSNDACYSRHIGCIIANSDYRIISMGYNGPPTRTPHCDDYDYLINFFIPQLSEEELKELHINNQLTKEKWAAMKHQCQQCPRRLINAGPGERSTLCSCQHAERNAITNATVNLNETAIYCWCGVPCIDCTGAIINSGITECHTLYVDGPDYHPTSRWLLREGGVEHFEYSEKYFQ